MIVREPIVIQQRGDPLRSRPAGPPVLISGLVVSQPDGLPALFCEGELVQQLRRCLAVILMHLRMVELEGVDLPVSHVLAAALVDMLGGVDPIDPAAGIHVHVASLRQGLELLVGKCGLVHPIPALQGLDHGVRRRRVLCLLLCWLPLTLPHLRRTLLGGVLRARRQRLRDLRLLGQRLRVLGALCLLGHRGQFLFALGTPAISQIIPPGLPVPAVRHPGRPVHGLRHAPSAVRLLGCRPGIRREHAVFLHDRIGVVNGACLVIPDALPDIPPGQVHAACCAAHGHAGQGAAHAGPYHLRHAVQVRLLPGLVLV